MIKSEFEKKFYIRKQIEEEICSHIKCMYGIDEMADTICMDIQTQFYLSKSFRDRDKLTVKYIHNEPTVPCGSYGCKNPRRVSQIWCDGCQKEYREDPDAFK